ncbi:MAG TPA: hypothetical protein VMX54_16275 [Vicinamibacteria bacterium]|nr:hypothetical protein [Vicinamibacteria bacterium]
MRRWGERGSGRLSGLIALAVLVAAGYAAWNVAPVYFDHYDFVDKVNEICRTPRYKVHNSDDEIMRMLMDEVKRRRLQDWIGPESFQIITTDHDRQIKLYYERETEVLPGWKHTFKFPYTADQPLV